MMLRLLLLVLSLMPLLALAYDGEVKAELKTFSLRDTLSKLSQDMVLHKVIYSPHFKKLIVFFYDYDTREESWAILEPDRGELSHRGSFPYTRFKEGVLIDPRHLLTLSWKPNVSLYLTDISTGETRIVYHRDKGKAGYNFTLMSPLISIRSGLAVSYVDLVDEEGFTEKLLFITIELASNGVKLKPWIAHEDISPERKPLRTISFDYPRGIAFTMDDGIYVFTDELRMIEKLRDEKGRVLDFKRGRLALLKWRGRGLDKTLRIYQVLPEVKLIRGFSVSELGGVPLGAQFSDDGRLFIELYKGKRVWFAYYDGNSLVKIKADGRIRGISFSVSADGSQIVVLGKGEYQVLKVKADKE